MTARGTAEGKGNHNQRALTNLKEVGGYRDNRSKKDNGDSKNYRSRQDLPQDPGERTYRRGAQFHQGELQVENLQLTGAVREGLDTKSAKTKNVEGKEYGSRGPQKNPASTSQPVKREGIRERKRCQSREGRTGEVNRTMDSTGKNSASENDWPPFV